MGAKESPTSSNEKADMAAHYEDPEIPMKEEHRTEQIADYAGAVEKSDPKEIALVRKLDMRIMPTLWVRLTISICSSIRHWAY